MRKREVGGGDVVDVAIADDVGVDVTDDDDDNDTPSPPSSPPKNSLPNPSNK